MVEIEVLSFKEFEEMVEDSLSKIKKLREMVPGKLFLSTTDSFIKRYEVNTFY